MCEFVIRKGTEKDFGDVLTQIKELAEFEKAPNAVTNSISQMKHEKNLFDFFVAIQKGKMIGYALYFFSYSTWVGKSLYLEAIYVRPECRNVRVGSRLLMKVFEVARKEKCKRIRWQVLKWNKTAIEFYKRYGAEIHHEWLNCDFDEEGIKEVLRKNQK
jgi:diamine N-acetyltransferase